MALNSGSLCCELAVCEFLCAHKSMQQFLAALHANTFSSMFWFPSLSLSVCVSACAEIVYTHINRYSYCMRVVKKASSLHNKPISCGFKMPFMKHVLAFMHIKLVGLPSKNKLAKGIQSATINWHKHTRIHTHVHTNSECEPFFMGHRRRPNIMYAQMALGVAFAAVQSPNIAFIFTHINTPTRTHTERRQ